MQINYQGTVDFDILNWGDTFKYPTPTCGQGEVPRKSTGGLWIKTNDNSAVRLDDGTYDEYPFNNVIPVEAKVVVC